MRRFTWTVRFCAPTADRIELEIWIPISKTSNPRPATPNPRTDTRNTKHESHFNPKTPRNTEHETRKPKVKTLRQVTAALGVKGTTLATSALQMIPDGISPYPLTPCPNQP